MTTCKSLSSFAVSHVISCTEIHSHPGHGDLSSLKKVDLKKGLAGNVFQEETLTGSQS